MAADKPQQYRKKPVVIFAMQGHEFKPNVWGDNCCSHLLHNLLKACGQPRSAPLRTRAQGVMRTLALDPDWPAPRPLDVPLRLEHARACPAHGDLLDQDGACPQGHHPPSWYVVRLRPGRDPAVVCASAEGLGPKLENQPRRRKAGGKPSPRASWLAQTSWRLRRKGLSWEAARAEAERRWATR